MQFSLVAFFAVLATGVAAAPTPLFMRQDTCDIATCVIDLGGSVVSCAAAAAQVGVDPISDAGCLFAAAKTVTSFPPSCNGCLEKFGVSVPTATIGGAIGSAETAVENGISSLGSDIAAGVHTSYRLYLDDAHAQERVQIFNLVQSEDSKSTEMLRGYVREAMRLNPQFTGLWRDVAADASIPQGKGLPPMNVKAGDRIWASFKNAHTYQRFHTCPGVTYAEQTIAEIVKVVFKLKNVRRAEGDSGKLAGFKQIINETETNVFITPYGTTSPWPGSMFLAYDD
ncbi:hypothetical protein C8F04DRAFT_1398916 [Mycena alexandri]|uniref:Fungal calcium binding protein domain-containing protein n=1 Tax=Mycena alexandri TaxID=1745969 RepID=A0AAD6SMJ7_9AGAR|nr:hypothetical protein C8F04DRAFT_1398916 [Mycena alexandri]